ncbi:hypothetical protein [Acinetobacter baumannii]|uniref:hypothetical protein n=1 Tax=Acinetobacter baumannii TaxID=470 RepID=UPI001CDD7831|nr:hypothetical protein [Acinetobacter baumannii]MCA4384393.1 hypothetical protein [Acinetobacter baumannii]
MSYANAFFEGMRSAFDLAPKQKVYKANFIRNVDTPKVNVHVLTVEKAGAWITVGSYMKKAGTTYQIQHKIDK